MKFEIRAYGVGELAQLYRPEVGSDTARRWMFRAISYRKGLTEELKALGYRKGMHTFTPAQVRAIVRGIGGP